MSALILATAGAALSWLAYLVGLTTGEHRTRHEVDRLRRHLTDTRPITDRIDP